MIELNKIYNNDCLELIKEMEKQEITPDLIICDPPYEFTSSGGGIYSLPRTTKMLNKIKEIKTDTFDFNKYIPKILDIQKNKVNAYFFTNKTLIPQYLQEATKRKLLFDILIFRKLNPLPAFNNAYMNDIEYIIFLRSPKTYFSGKEGYKNYSKHYAENIGHHKLTHPNQKPLKLIKKFIQVSSKEGELVADFFLGSGTTAVASKELNRKYIGTEINKEYIYISERRLKETTKTKTLEEYQWE